MQGHRRRRRRLLIDRSSGDVEDLALRLGGLQLGRVARVGDDQLGPGGRDPVAQILGPQLLVARERDRPDAKAGEHAQHPLGPVADQRHHHVTLGDPTGGEGAGQSGGVVGHLAERPLAPVALASQLDERAVARWGGGDDIS